MGYETNLTGEIEITPHIPWKYVRESVFLPENAVKGVRLNQRDVMFRIAEHIEDTDDGTLIWKSAVALVPTHRNYAGSITKHVQEVVDAFPEYDFSEGRIDAEGEGDGSGEPDVWRLKVVDRVATEFRPKLIWPEESE